MSPDGTNALAEITRPRRRRRAPWIVAALAGVALAAGAAWLLRPADKGPRYVTAEVTRGDISEAIEATGTVAPVLEVVVGAQVSGRVASVNVDFNHVVKKGDLLATLEPAPFEADLAQVRAAHASALAQLQRARIDVETQRKNLARTQELVDKGLTARADLDAAQGAHDLAVAQVQVGQAQVEQAKANVDRARENLAYTKITAPIDGTIISRSVDPGQTVAASLQAPVLFVIANDLTTMRVLASIDEADVGKVEGVTEAQVRVDAFPNDVFLGAVREVRVQPTTTSGVVTYPAVVDVPNADKKLRPGMTATVTLVTSSKEGVLRVPNAALRYEPSTPGAGRAAGGRPPRGARGAKRIYVPGEGTAGEALPAPRAIEARVGISDGAFTEISGEGIEEGMKVIVDEQGGGPVAPLPSGGSQRRAPRLF
jgi:HlyD family secretion protein